MVKRLLGVNSGIVLYGANKSTQKSNSSLDIMYSSLQKDKKYVLVNLPKSGLVHTKYSFAYQITLCFWMWTSWNLTNFWMKKHKLQIDVTHCIGKYREISRWLKRKINIWMNTCLWCKWYQSMELLCNVWLIFLWRSNWIKTFRVKTW